MQYLPLIWAGLSRHAWRTLLTFLSVVVAFVLFGALRGVTGGFDAAIDALSDSRLFVQNRAGWTCAAVGIGWACVSGLIGGRLPAIRAARQPVATTLRPS